MTSPEQLMLRRILQSQMDTLGIKNSNALARRSKVSQSIIWRIFNDDNYHPMVDKIFKLFKALEIPLPDPEAKNPDSSSYFQFISLSPAERKKALRLFEASKDS